MVFAALETLEAGIEALAGSAFDVLSEKDCVSVCERLMTVGRKIPSAQYEFGQPAQ